MAYRMLANSIAVFCFLFAVGSADEGQQPPKKPKVKKPAPVQLSARLPKTESKAKTTVEISLAIGDEYEIFSERKHDFLLPLKVELLDTELQPIESKVLFPKPKLIQFGKALGGSHFVYYGKPKFVATCSAKAKPAYVRSFYHGYSKRGYWLGPTTLQLELKSGKVVTDPTEPNNKRMHVRTGNGLMTSGGRSRVGSS